MDSESAHVIRWKHQFENPNQTWLKLKPEFQPKLVNSYTEVFWPRNELQEPIRNENGMTESETLCDIFSNLNINSTVSLDKMKKIFKDESNWSRAEAGFQNACPNLISSILKTNMRITTIFLRMWFTLKWQTVIMSIFFALIHGEFAATFLNIFSRRLRHKR